MALASPPAKAPFKKAIVTSFTSSVGSLSVAVPVKRKATVVALSRSTMAVRPAGTLVTLTTPSATKSSPSAPVKVSPPVRLMVIAPSMAPWTEASSDSVVVE